MVVGGGSAPTHQIGAVGERCVPANGDVYPPRVISCDMRVEAVDASTFGIDDGDRIERNVDRLAEPQRDLSRRSIVDANGARGGASGQQERMCARRRRIEGKLQSC